MSILLKPVRVLYVIYALLLWLAIMFLILPPIILASLLGRIRGGNITFYFLRLWADLWFPMVGIWVRKIREDNNEKGTFLYVVNHRSYLDAAIAVKVMGLPFRPLGKIEMKKIPFFGFIYRQSVVLVDRASTAGRAASVREMMTMVRKGISILIFPEGTTNETNQLLTPFHNGAFRIAIETQTPLKPVLYLDSGIRFSHKRMLDLSPGRCRVLFLPSIPVAGLTMEDLPALKQRVFSVMHAALKEHSEYPDVPVKQQAI
ncbi:1-acyl-sn-glycerol-3-phosphate acyltransferase [Chitinophaga agrisoli]|uniref:1-acyl-sn-glycerol-3-phosphate acyltransferase n=1 Tax=Chitinophaga agrisoli TaxID=2607653 RepID=A0A5B2VN90_9BACT|nr:lysophospholipid acyltransferase family protein [Chitinophaga agrisoli]KAA2240168.1 1-acyl-sn-glycerol-3-phosphate acyltransferase [Chitinophaga agrisoli]